ncbi:flagellar basal body M-ring protein FliF [Burkholderia sp. WAC0059]|uniref:flagellar basal-body MS-ring/collar protein FliF n=1 Tax=Burkholderia sp. WAC0059 TaxID=2066022 RepID=UPI000C7ED1DD|nr:flagellar basal-body MS-ring/collar protein FliF [Burkholderia sp. WAC0059]PLZ00680.1 flagellar basal body M-ring protein FliF [Burkholderia sp. WAC0059]
MDSPANSLVNPDARMGLAAPGATPAGAGQGAADDFGSTGAGGFAQRLGSLQSLRQIRGNPRLPFLVAVAVLIAVVAGLVLWSRAPDYRILYSGLADQDGGAIIAALQTANVPYRLAEGGSAILVPSDVVNETRLRLASQGLPKSGSVGFELMDNEKFGISQFAEQVNYQRALEGELEQTIESIDTVKSARVHLAIPKPSVFVRDQEAPTASVLVDLYPGRMLDEGQVSAIAHLIASAVPDLPVSNVTVVDQDGNLLTQSSSAAGLDASQLRYERQVELDTQQHIDDILAPLFGAGNARAQVSADLDFSKLEQTAETYDPNSNQQQQAIRSQQTSSATDMQQGGASGVPGALSNQPPQPTAAPVNAPNGQPASAPPVPVSDHRDQTTNYELNHTVRHYLQVPGSIKRLSVAVVVNDEHLVDAHGHVTDKPLTAQQLAQVEQLVKDAMGYDAKRGDTVNVVNSAFMTSTDDSANLPWWRQPDIIALAKQVATWVGIGAVALFLYFAMVKPAMRRAFPPPEPPAATALAGPSEPLLLDGLPPGGGALEENADEKARLAFENERQKFERNLEFARNIARQDPKLVATVVRSWVNDEH